MEVSCKLHTLLNMLLVERTSTFHWIGDCVGRRAGVDISWEEKNLLSMPEIEPWIIWPMAYANLLPSLMCNLVINTEFVNNACLFWRSSPHWARASSFMRFLDHTQRCTTVGRTPLDEWSAYRRDLYLTTHTTLTTDKYPCPQWDSNPQSQQVSSRKPTP